MIKIKNKNLLKKKKGYASSYNVEILRSFNPELQLKDTEHVIKNKLKQLLPELRKFKFVVTLVLFKKIEIYDETKYDTFDSHSKAKQKQLLMKVTLMMYLNQSIVHL